MRRREKEERKREKRKEKKQSRRRQGQKPDLEFLHQQRDDITVAVFGRQMQTRLVVVVVFDEQHVAAKLFDVLEQRGAVAVPCHVVHRVGLHRAP